MSLVFAIRHQLGNFTLDAAFQSQGRLTALLGASGSGKTSVINVIAGLIRPHSGKVLLNSVTLTDTERGIHVPAHRRSIGYVFQDSRLFPHLSVGQNLGYGRWFTPQASRYADMAQIVELLDIAALLERKPHQLSGGEKQRVAVGRALLQSPRLLLMDEPLASLDQARKLEIMPYIERLRDEMRIPIVYVSHSFAEVARLATDIVIIAQGRVTRSGPAEEIVRRLGFAETGLPDESATLLTMPVAAYDPVLDLTTLSSAAGEARVPGRIAAPGKPVRLLINARDVIVATEKPRGLSALNIFAGTIVSIEGRETSAPVNVGIRCGDSIIVARITRQSLGTLHLEQGQRVFAIVKSVAIDTPAPAPVTGPDTPRLAPAGDAASAR